MQSRCIIEGQEILNAKHIILLGKTSDTIDSLEILALCLQTSEIKSRPHEIKGCFKIVENDVHIEAFQCSCKAGMSGTCKHIAAVLYSLKSFLNVLMDFNEDFIKESNLTAKYFEFMIHVIWEAKK